MTLPNSEYYPDDPEQLPPARRRRAQRLVVPAEGDERTAFLADLTHRTSPSVDFYLFSLLGSVVIGLGLLLDAPALLLLGALSFPLMGPAVGICLGTVLGSVRFFTRSFVGLLIGSSLVFLGGVLTGLIMQIWAPESLDQANYYAQLSWPNFIVLAVGMILTTIGMVQGEYKPLVPSVALAFELNVPLVVAGIGLGSGIPNFFPDGLVIFAIYLSWAALLGAFALALIGLRPLTFFGYTLGGAVTLVSIILLIGISSTGVVFEAQMALPTSTVTITPSLTPVPPTRTLTPSPVPPTETPTVTPSPTRTITLTPTLSPTPTPVFAFIDAPITDPNSPPGVYLRQEPDWGTVITSLDNGTRVQVMPESLEKDGFVWVRIIVVATGQEGWVLQSLLLVATPPPNW